MIDPSNIDFNDFEKNNVETKGSRVIIGLSVLAVSILAYLIASNAKSNYGKRKEEDK